MKYYNIRTYYNIGDDEFNISNIFEDIKVEYNPIKVRGFIDCFGNKFSSYNSIFDIIYESINEEKEKFMQSLLNIEKYDCFGISYSKNNSYPYNKESLVFYDTKLTKDDLVNLYNINHLIAFLESDEFDKCVIKLDETNELDKIRTLLDRATELIETVYTLLPLPERLMNAMKIKYELTKIVNNIYESLGDDICREFNLLTPEKHITDKLVIPTSRSNICWPTLEEAKLYIDSNLFNKH